MKTVKKILKMFFLTFFLFLFFLLGLDAEIYYPWKDVYIGALEGRAWAGLAFAPQKENVFAFRLRIKRGNETADREDMFYLISEVGPHSPDGMYTRIKFDLSLPFGEEEETPILIKPSSRSDTMVLEWSRQDEKTVVGRIIAPEYIELEMVHYFPWDFRGRYQLLPDGYVKGESVAAKNYHYLLWTHRQGNLISSTSDDEFALSFSMTEERRVYFVVGVDEDARILNDHIYRYKNVKTIDRILDEEKDRYRKQRVRIEGLFKGVPESITNNLFWMMLYQPEKHRLYTPAGRRWIFPQPDGTLDHWTIFEWDSFLNALEVSIESTKHARDILMSVLETQYPNGNIPNWRGRFGGAPDRSQPPVGSYVVLKIFQKSGDTELLKFAYPRLKKWHAFWRTTGDNGQIRRDGNGDGLLEWGSDRDLIPGSVPPWEENVTGKTRAMWESGQDDLPNWDDASFQESSGTLTMNCVDLNSLYALDSWCLAEMANVLDRKQDYKTYLDEYENMKRMINTHFWDEKEGFYFDRHWDGSFSRKKAASNFYPMLARVPDQRKALRMLRHLLDINKFWGEYILPTISRDDSTFNDQQYWRGTIWPPTNYLVYQGLKAYGLDAVASEYAKKSVSLFLQSWENLQLCPENYDSRTGEAGGQRFQSWGPLLALIGIEEYIDFTPWEGFRFGMINPEEKGKLSRISIQGRHYDIEISDSKVKLKEEGKEIVKTNGGAVFRHFFYSERDVSFDVKTLEERKIEIKLLAKGRYHYWIDDQLKKPFTGKSLKIKIPEGDHSVLILLVEEK